MMDRSYRKSLGKDAAIKELINGSGTQFDPKVVNTFVNILKLNQNI
jgi:HD-GYP domain-containing protein (c-di-GMP phosphodiesterase class II)